MTTVDTVASSRTANTATAADLTELSAIDLITRFRAGKLSPVEVTEAVLARIAQFEPRLNAFALLDADGARRAASESAARWRTGRPLGPVDGVPVALKDLLLAKGWPTLRGSKAVDPAQPWDEDSPAAARLRESGAVILGKTTTAEFGWKALADSPLTGVTRNPWNLEHTPGGSSGGAAAAAAFGFGPLHVATDGGGSTRLPASYSGLVGFKPSFGRVPGYPSAHTGTLFHVTPLTRTVGDAALLLNTIARPDARDWHALPHDERDWLQGLDGGVRGLRIAFSPTLGYAQVDPEVAEIVARAVAVFTELGAVVDHADPGFDDPLPLYRVLADAAAARLFANHPAECHRLFEPGLQAVAERGRDIDAVRYLGAVQQREALGRRLALFHDQWNLLVTPTTAVTAPKADYETKDLARHAVPSPFAYPFNLTQQPAISVPAGLTRAGLPVGLQIVGPKYADRRVLRAARAFELARPFARIARDAV